MSKRFSQNPLHLIQAKSNHRIKVSSLMTLVENHPYKANIETAFNIYDIGDEYITIDYIDLVHKQIANVFKKFNRLNIKANIRNISIVEQLAGIDGINGTPVKFIFEEFKDENGDTLNDLEAFAIYDAKASFLNQYEMAKYANKLYKEQLFDLFKYNIEYFKQLAATSKNKDKQRSYRLLEHNGELFVRGITSVNQYNEYGVDFAFVVAMLSFHKMMKDYPGDNFAISSAAISASKLEIIIENKFLKEAEGFGNVSSSTIVTTNDLGNASFRFQNVIRVGVQDSRGVYIFPEAKSDYKKELVIKHNTKANNALQSLKHVKDIIRSVDEFIVDLKGVKGIKTPDELRARILFKLENRNSLFKDKNEVKMLFKDPIKNTVENFAKLLEMCRKAEELDIDYDLKDKLRYIISDIILNKK